MSDNQGLFRQEVLEPGSARAVGEIVLIHPLPHYLLLAFAAICASTLLVFAIAGHYTRHETIQGVLEPSQGLVKLYAAQNGVLMTATVSEGQQVRKGQVLMRFETQHANATGQAVESELDTRLQDRLQALHQELGGTIRLHESDREGLQQQLKTVLGNRETLAAELQLQIKRVQSAEQAVARYDSLQKAGFLSDAQAQQKTDEVLEQRLRLKDLEKAIRTADTEIVRVRSDLAAQPVRKQVSVAQISHNIAQTEAELSKQRNEHEWTVVAPCDGIVTSLTIMPHQTATTGVPLVSIMPSTGDLQASLYAPSHSLGFLSVGQRVRIKLDAYPFQKFGFLEGKIVAIADSPIRPAENSPTTKLSTSGDISEPTYSIRVALDQQYIVAYSAQQHLRPGLQLAADVQLDTRQLYEWAFEPLFSLSGSW